MKLRIAKKPLFSLAPLADQAVLPMQNQYHLKSRCFQALECTIGKANLSIPSNGPE
jgi:hypothetical protein